MKLLAQNMRCMGFIDKFSLSIRMGFIDKFSIRCYSFQSWSFNHYIPAVSAFKLQQLHTDVFPKNMRTDLLLLCVPTISYNVFHSTLMPGMAPNGGMMEGLEPPLISQDKVFAKIYIF